MTQTLPTCISADMLAPSLKPKGVAMRGSVATSQVCPKCEGKFDTILVDYGVRKEKDLVCRSCLTRPDNYFVRVYLPKDIESDPNKRNLRIYSDSDGHTLSSYDEANRVLIKIQEELKDKTFSRRNYQAGEVEAYRGKTLFPKWLKTKKALSPTHLSEVERYVRLYFIPFFSDKNLQNINTAHIEDFHLWLEDEQIEKGRKPLSVKTQKNIMTMLRNFCNWLHNRETIARVPIFPKISPPQAPIIWITKEHQLSLLKAIPDPYRAIYHFMMYHPLRSGEVRALKVKDIDLKARTVHVERAFSGKEVRSRKNKKDYYIPLSETFDPAILRGKLPDAWLFTTPTGRVYSREYLPKLWKDNLEKASLRHVALKDATRNSIASQAINRGVSMEAVSKTLGHSSIQITADRYAKMEVETMRGVIDADNVVDLSSHTAAGGDNKLS